MANPKLVEVGKGVVMQTLKQSFEERNLAMTKHTANLTQDRKKRILLNVQS